MIVSAFRVNRISREFSCDSNSLLSVYRNGEIELERGREKREEKEREREREREREWKR